MSVPIPLGLTPAQSVELYVENFERRTEKRLIDVARDQDGVRRGAVYDVLFEYARWLRDRGITLIDADYDSETSSIAEFRERTMAAEWRERQEA